MHAPSPSPWPSPARLALTPDGVIEGYASLFGEIDQARDMMMPGAFTQTLKQRGLRKIPMLFQHDPSEPVGVWLEMKEDLRGLWARGRLIPDVTRARELLALLQAGAVDGLSIGYRTQRGQIEPKTRVRKLYQVDLWEVSIVTFPLLNGARVSAVKEAPRSRLRAERDWTQLTGDVAGSHLTGLSGAADAPPAPVIRRGRKASGPVQTCSLRARADRKRALGAVSAGVAFRRKSENRERT
ncbi:HK97 family phage prohead protease [Tardiphaga sp. OK245]|uniref:HK97 family phage prohead protease n=1 Tax=Tardiphaga sp. OK245 TaxID=1855306 RepID=UPI0008A7A083|nr:HK97 family phage prohead protease [Tardiphaga sp. OK245]SEI09225.1 prohead peptidase. Unknown type peptidase. MEROPS family U35 [Tardiphaga sp. OK245]